MLIQSSSAASLPNNAQIVINEVMSSNNTTLADDNGDYEDWIELYHAGDEPVDLNGWALSDDVIYYTLDRSEPTTDSPVHEGPISIYRRDGEENYLSMIRTTPSSTWQPPTSEVFKGHGNPLFPQAWVNDLFNGFIENETFRNQFISILAGDLNTRFNPEFVSGRITEFRCKCL